MERLHAFLERGSRHPLFYLHPTSHPLECVCACGCTKLDLSCSFCPLFFFIFWFYFTHLRFLPWWIFSMIFQQTFYWKWWQDYLNLSSMQTIIAFLLVDPYLYFILELCRVSRLKCTWQGYYDTHPSTTTYYYAYSSTLTELLDVWVMDLVHLPSTHSTSIGSW